MKKQRFSIEQIVSVLKQAELGFPVADLVRQVGISEQTSENSRAPTSAGADLERTTAS